MEQDDDEEFQCELTDAEKALRKKFAAIYLDCHDQLTACLRLGYSPSFAQEYARRFMSEAYTLDLIRKGRAKVKKRLEDKDFVKSEALYGLYTEAHAAAQSKDRISAWSNLGKIAGIEAPIKVDQTVTTRTAGSELHKKLTLEELELLDAMAERLANATNGATA